MAMRSLLVLLIACAATYADDPIHLEAAGSVTVPSGRYSNRMRMSPTGRWLVVATAVTKDKARDSWSYGAFRLIDLEKGVIASARRKLRLGANSPVFSPDGRWLAWADATDPTRLRIHRRDLRTSGEREFVFRLDAGTKGFATLCAIDEKGRRVAVAEPDGRHPALVVRDLEEGKLVRRFQNLKEPYMGIAFEVVLRGRHLLHHTRLPLRADGASYELLLTDVESGKVRRRSGAYVATKTPRFRVTSTFVVNGTGDFGVEEINLRTAAPRMLFEAHKQLYSHFLEVTLSPDERHVIAWSGARKTLVVYDRVSRTRFDIETPEGGSVLGVAHDNRHVLVQDAKGILTVDLAKRTVGRHVLRGRWHWSMLDPTGHTLVLADRKRESGGLRALHLHRVK